MRKGVLVGNGSLRSEKFEELYRLLGAAAAERGAELTLVRNTELVLPVGGRMSAAREGAVEEGGQEPSAPGEHCGDAHGERAPVHGGAAALGGGERPEQDSAAESPRRGADLRSARPIRGGDAGEMPSAPREADTHRSCQGAGRRSKAVEKSAQPDGRDGVPLPEQLRGADFVLFWDKDVRLARAIERTGIPVYNSARAIELCDDKRLTHEMLAAAGISMPRTVMGPLVFGPCDFVPFARGVETLFSYPVVVKEAFGSFGAQVYLAKSREELVALCGSIAPRPFLVSEFVKESAGRDLRLQVVGGRVIAAMERRGQRGDFRAGLTSGGKMFPFTPDREAETLALRAAEALGCDFAGVDLLFGAEGYLVCEVNSNAHFKNLFDLTGVNAAGPILDLALGRGA